MGKIGKLNEQMISTKIVKKMEKINQAIQKLVGNSTLQGTFNYPQALNEIDEIEFLSCLVLKGEMLKTVQTKLDQYRNRFNVLAEFCATEQAKVQLNATEKSI